MQSSMTGSSKPVIQLSSSELYVGSQVGIIRQVQNLRKDRKPGHGAPTNNDWQWHIEGALGELALSKYLDVRWDFVGKLRQPDVGIVDVRTRSRHNYELPIHHIDDDDRRIWLLTGLNGIYTVHGWILAKEGKQEKWWKDPGTGRPAFFVPQEALNRDD